MREFGIVVSLSELSLCRRASERAHDVLRKYQRVRVVISVEGRESAFARAVSIDHDAFDAQAERKMRHGVSCLVNAHRPNIQGLRVPVKARLACGI